MTAVSETEGVLAAPVLVAGCANCGFRWMDVRPCVCPLCGYAHNDGEFVSWERSPDAVQG